MNAQTPKVGGASRIAVLALSLLLAACPFDKEYKIGGTVSGLTGAGLVLQNNGGDDLAISANGPFGFSKKVKKGKGYNVTVLTQPAGQTCTVANGSGKASREVTDVAVTCTGGGYTVGGTVSGLTATGLVLRNNGGDDLPIAASGTFAFATALANGAAYNVTVSVQPAGQGCVVANASGTIAGASVTNVAVSCAAPPAAPTVNTPLGFGVKELQFSWTAVSGAAFYRLLENPDGASPYTPAASNITATSFNYTIPVHLRLNASYKVEACNPGGCTASAPVDVGTDLVRAIGYMKSSNAGAGDQFGFSIALSGDGSTLAVGAQNEDSSNTGVNGTPDELANNAGAVYVFAKSAGAWSQQAYLKASNTAAGDTFGVSIALSSDGNTLAAGARGQGGLAGAAYVFARSGGTWSQQAFLTASNAEAPDLFGNAITLSGDGNTLAVGAPFEASDHTGVIPGAPDETATGNAASFSGAVYVFTRSGAAWSQQAYVKASNTESFDAFGSSVALNGDGSTLAVGAPNESSDLTGVTPGSVSEATTLDNAANAGAVYVFARTAGTWAQQAYVKASNTGSGDQFGTSVAVSSDGNTLAVGAPFEDGSGTGIGSPVDEAAADAGAVYVYSRSGTTWTQQAFVKASNTGAGDQFGFSVALSGDGNSLAVGAPQEDGSGSGIGAADDDANVGAGAVYFYSRSGATWSTKSYVKASNNAPTEGGVDSNFGAAVALSSDGGTLAVGAPLEDSSTTGVDSTPDSSATSAGAAYLY